MSKGFPNTSPSKVKVQEVRDEDNPEFMLQGKSINLLKTLANGKFDLQKMAQQELANQGLNPKTGKWVGFDKAAAMVKK